MPVIANQQRPKINHPYLKRAGVICKPLQNQQNPQKNTDIDLEKFHVWP